MSTRPRRAVPGQPLTAEMWNSLVDALDALRPLAGPGVELRHTAGGVLVAAAGVPTLHVAKATSSITKAVGLTVGSGTATVQQFSGTALSDGAPTLDHVYNFHTDKSANSGAIIAVFLWAGVWWLFDVDDCTHLT